MNSMNDKQVEMSYYGLYLRSYLQDVGCDVSQEVIDERAEIAAEQFEEARRRGISVSGSHELAMVHLLSGLMV